MPALESRTKVLLGKQDEAAPDRQPSKVIRTSPFPSSREAFARAKSRVSRMMIEASNQWIDLPPRS